MALTASFVADFSALTAAFNKATTQAETFQKSADAAGVALNTMVDALSSGPAIENAADLATAVESIEPAAAGASDSIEKVSKAADDAGNSFQLSAGSIAAFAAGFVTLNEAWKLVKTGFGVVKDFLVESVELAAKSSGVYSAKIAELTTNWQNLQVSIGQAVTQNQTVIALFDEVSTAIKGMQEGFSGNRDTMNLVSDTVILLVQSFSLLMNVIAQLAYPIRQTIKEFKFFPDAAAKAVHAVLLMEQALVKVGIGSAEGVRNLQAAEATLRGYSASMQTGVEATDKFIEVSSTVATKASELAERLKETRGQVVAQAAAVEDSTAAEKEALGALNKKVEAELRSARATIASAGATKTVTIATEDYAVAMRLLEGSTSGAVSGIEKLPPALDDTVSALEQSRGAAGGLAVEYRKVASAAEELPPALETAAASTRSFGSTMTEYFGGEFGRTVVGALQGGGSVIQSAMAGLGNAIVGKDSALAGTISKGVSSVFGSSGMMGQIGSMIGSFVPAIGPMLAPAIEGVTKLFSSLFGGGEEAQKVSPLRDEFFALAGGIETLNPKVEKLTGNFALVEGVLRAETVEEYNAAIGELNGLFAMESAAIEEVTATAQKYGITIEELGPAMRRQELDKQAQQLYRDWEMLNAAGIKTSVITKKMADEVNKYVKQATKMGGEVPAAMRPMLERMAEMGVLTDKSGKKVTDLEKSGIKFAMSMSDGFNALISEVQQLSNVLAKSLGVELERTADRVEAIPDEVNVQVKYDDPGPPRHSGTSVPGYQGGTGGKFVDFGAGSLVMLHGREAVVPESTVRPAGLSPTAAVAGSSAGVTIIINANGSFFDTPGDLQRLAAKVNEALTAKYGQTNRLRAA